MDKNEVSKAVEELKSEGKRPSVRSVMAKIGGRTETVVSLLREVLGNEPPAEENGLPDWRADPRVVELKTREEELRAELAKVEETLRDARRRRDEAPSVLRKLFADVIQKRVPRAEVTTFQASSAQRDAAVAELEAQAGLLTQELEALPDVRREVEAAAQHAAVTALQAAYQADAADLLAAYEQCIAVTARMDEHYQQALKQFPHGVYGAPRSYAADIQPAGGLQPLYDKDFVKLQRGIGGLHPSAPWDRWVLGHQVKTVVDGLRKALSLPEDRGEISAEGQIALAEHQARGRAEQLARETAQRHQVRRAQQAGV